MLALIICGALALNPKQGIPVDILTNSNRLNSPTEAYLAARWDTFKQSQTILEIVKNVGENLKHGEESLSFLGKDDREILHKGYVKFFNELKERVNSVLFDYKIWASGHDKNLLDSLNIDQGMMADTFSAFLVDLSRPKMDEIDEHYSGLKTSLEIYKLIFAEKVIDHAYEKMEKFKKIYDSLRQEMQSEVTKLALSLKKA